MTTRHLIEKVLEKMQHVNTVIPNLNCGGCGVFAHALAAELEFKGLKPKIAVISNRDVPKLSDDFAEKVLKEKNVLTARELNASGADIAHMMVYLEEEGLYIDSEGVYTSLRESGWSGYRHQFNMSVEHTCTIVESPDGWNSRFDRNFIPKIYQIVFSAVNKVIKEFKPQPLQLTLDF
jgi:hypothetical protein